MRICKYSEHIILSVVLISITQLAYAWHSGVFSGYLADPDCYTWLVRAAQFQETRLWFDPILYRVDPPYGLEQHWTRPFDVLLLVGAWALTPLFGFEKALYAWGVLISPMLQIAAVLCLIWAFAPVFNHRQLVFLALGFIAQPAIFGSFVIGRPDHHSLITLLFVVALGFIVRMMQEPARKLWAWGGGFVSALGFWVCIELGVFVILPVIVFLSILWFLKEKDVGTTFFNYSASLLFFSAAALLIENGFSEFLRLERDRLSIVFVLFFAMITLYAFFAHQFKFADNTLFRVLFAGLAAMGVMSVMQFLYQQISITPEVEHLYREIRTGSLGQDKLIYSLQWPEGIYTFISWAGIIIPVSLWFVYSLFTRKWWQGLFSSPRKAMYIKLSIFVLVSLYFYSDYVTQLRYVVYLQIICLLGYVVLMDNAVKLVESRLGMSKMLPVVRTLVMFLMLTWFFYPLALHGNKESFDPGYDSNIVSTSRYLHEITKNEDMPLNIMAAPELGSTLLYHTNNNVFTFTNHRNLHGFNDWYNIMTSEIDEQALSIVDERQVDMILINKPLDKIYFHDQKENVLVHRLMSGEEVSWLERVETPDDVPQDILIYMVVNGNEF